MLARSFLISALVGFVSAQLSSQCTNTLTGVAANPQAAACLSLSSLIPIVIQPSNSVVGPVNQWLTTVCAAAPCSNDVLAAVITNVTSGCTADLGSLGITPDQLPSIIPLIQQYYPPVRQVLCLKDGNTNCVTQTLTNIEGTTGTLNVNRLTSLVTSGASTLTNLPANISCTNCIKAAYNAVNAAVPGIISDAAPALQQKCGATFTDGQTPVGITQSASNATAGSNPTNTQGGGAEALIAQGGLLTLLTFLGVVLV